MKKLDEMMEELRDRLPDMSFSQIVREARDSLGLMQYRTAEHLCMGLGRLKNLETGYFRVMPSAAEIRDICEFFGLPQDLMITKAEEHVAARAKDRKVRTSNG